MRCTNLIVLATLIGFSLAITPFNNNPKVSTFLSIPRGGESTPNDEPSSADMSRSMYNKQANNWSRMKPSCLSDFTGIDSLK